MIKIEIKNRYTDSVIFEFSKEKNTIKKTVLEYIELNHNADLSYANLNNADLRNADLSYANLSNANLSNADLSNADLRNADLRNADLRNANLSNADLSKADLSYANLSNAYLSKADLSYAYLSKADLSYADLRYADLSNANLNYIISDLRFITVGCIGSSKRQTTYCFDSDIIWCGCFKGSLNQFELMVKKTHSNNEQYLKEYLNLISYIESLK